MCNVNQSSADHMTIIDEIMKMVITLIDGHSRDYEKICNNKRPLAMST